MSDTWWSSFEKQDFQEAGNSSRQYVSEVWNGKVVKEKYEKENQSQIHAHSGIGDYCDRGVFDGAVL